MTLEELYRAGVAALREAGIGNAGQEARWLLEHGVGIDGRDFVVHPRRSLASGESTTYRELLSRRIDGEPLQYILASTEFYGMELEVGPGVLIPRPETERLVDLALERIEEGGRVCDLCTGCGAIALALAQNCPFAVEMIGTDISKQALDYARRNLARVRSRGRVRFLRGDLFASVPDELPFTLVTANPPYVSPDDFCGLPREIKEHEPREALLAAEGGLAIIRRIARESRHRIVPGGWLLCEIGSDQGERAQCAFRQCGYKHVQICQDYTARDRIVVARV